MARLSLSQWLVTYFHGLLTKRWQSIPVLTGQTHYTIETNMLLQNQNASEKQRQAIKHEALPCSSGHQHVIHSVLVPASTSSTVVTEP